MNVHNNISSNIICSIIIYYYFSNILNNPRWCIIIICRICTCSNMSLSRPVPSLSAATAINHSLFLLTGTLAWRVEVHIRSPGTCVKYCLSPLLWLVYNTLRLFPKFMIVLDLSFSFGFGQRIDSILQHRVNNRSNPLLANFFKIFLNFEIWRLLWIRIRRINFSRNMKNSTWKHFFDSHPLQCGSELLHNHPNFTNRWLHSVLDSISLFFIRFVHTNIHKYLDSRVPYKKLMEIPFANQAIYQLCDMQFRDSKNTHKYFD